MSNRLFQGLVYQMRDTVDRMIGVIDESATIIACSDLTKIGEPNDFLAADLGENNELFIRDGITYTPFGSKMKSEYAVLLVRVQANSSVSAFDVVQNLFPDKQKDFVFNVNETDIVLVKEVKPGIESKDLEKLARSIVDTLGGEFYTKAQVGIGSVIAGIKDLARSFREAQAALEVGKVFDTERLIVSYDNLGIARIIYQLPTTLCEQYLREVFKKGSIESLDHETLFTIQKFFENNLNVSETSRKLFVHRNTLVYRLEKIKKLTGLDLREFDHAIIFKVALMVKKYLTANPVKY